MDVDHDLFDWQTLSPEENKQQLFLKQKATLDSFLERGAISQAQYDKSFNDMKEKMGYVYQEVKNENLEQRAGCQKTKRNQR